jgi:hypothetical protein
VSQKKKADHGSHRRLLGPPKEKYSPDIPHDPAPRRLLGEAIMVDETSRARQTIRLRTEYPHAMIAQHKTGVEALAKVKWSSYGNRDIITYCMRCGQKMADRRNEVYDPNLKKWRLHLLFGEEKGEENWECTNCAPNMGGQPTRAFLTLLVHG